MNITEFNRRWLEAWSAKDVTALLTFYHPDAVYMDGQTVTGLRGHGQLRAYLEKLFAQTPPMRYEPDAIWAIDGGYCGRWVCTIDLPAGTKSYLRGFDLVLTDGERIRRNEVYTHTLPGPPEDA